MKDALPYGRVTLINHKLQALACTFLSIQGIFTLFENNYRLVQTVNVFPFAFKLLHLPHIYIPLPSQLLTSFCGVCGIPASPNFILRQRPFLFYEMLAMILHGYYVTRFLRRILVSFGIV